MANPRPPLSEDTVRFAHCDLLQRVTDQQKVQGEVADTQRAEALVRPILDKVINSHEDDRKRDMMRVSQREVKEQEAGERFEKTAWGKKRGLNMAESLGDFDWDLRTNQLKPSAGNRWKPPPDTPEKAALRRRIRFLYTMPEWRQKMLDIAFLDIPYKQRQRSYLKMLEQSIKIFGDPRDVRDPEIPIEDPWEKRRKQHSQSH